MHLPFQKLNKRELKRELSRSPVIVTPSSVHQNRIKELPALLDKGTRTENIHNDKSNDGVSLSTSQNKEPQFWNNTSYAGDIQIDWPTGTEFEVMEIPSPVHLMAFFMPDVRDGLTLLHDWQKGINNKLAVVKPTSKDPFQFALCACNGSGKDAFIIAPFAVWFCCTKIQSRCIITSASGQQLSSQTENYIRELCRKINDYTTANFGGPVFQINQRYIRSIKSGSEIRLFATDEEGKAEGYHPIAPGAEMAIIVNEAKSVSQEIYRALNRCTGYNYWIDVSSPGEPNGDFYEHFLHWENKLKVDYTMCPHHSDKLREADIADLGIENFYVRSKWLAEFTSLDSSSVIPIELVNKIRRMTSEGLIKTNIKSNDPKRVGLDLAAGGDETCVWTTHGNTIFAQYNFREKDTTVTASKIDQYLENELNLKKDHDFIYADDGGVSKAIVDMLVSIFGWVNIHRVNNQNAAADKARYQNRGAQNWYRVKAILDACVFRLDVEYQPEIFYKQLTNRFCKQDGSQGKLALEPKPQAKAHGRPSPDRADAFVLALTGCTKDDFLDHVKGEVPKNFRTTIASTPEAMQKWMSEQNDKELNGQPLFDQPQQDRPTRSLNLILKKQQNIHSNFYHFNELKRRD